MNSFRAAIEQMRQLRRGPKPSVKALHQIVLLVASVLMAEGATAAVASLCTGNDLPREFESRTLPGSGEMTWYYGSEGVPRGVLYDLHASGISALAEESVTASRRIARHLGLVLVLPHAVRPGKGGTVWNVPHDAAFRDDLMFIAQLDGWLDEHACVRGLPRFGVGFSGGARMLSNVVLHDPRRFRAIVAVGGFIYPRHDSQVVSAVYPAILAIHAAEDPVNPYRVEGNTSSPPYWHTGIEDSLRSWRNRLKCEPEADTESESEESVQAVDSTSAASPHLKLLVLREGGHVWPGSRFTFPEQLGSKTDVIDATAVATQFFEASF